MDIDWNAAWQQARSCGKEKRDKKGYWNKRADSFADHVKTSPYAASFLRLLEPLPDWSVLDVGCGAGTLALPLAPLVKRITAIDLSERMIELLGETCHRDQLTNIDARVVGWEDDWNLAGIGAHDVAIASRSLVVDDLRTAILKLESKARRLFVSSLVDDGPFDRRIFEAIGRDLNRGPDYIYLYNLLYQMGVRAEIRFVENSEGKKIYRDLDEAVDNALWMIDAITPEEHERLRRWFEKNLRKTTDGWRLDRQHRVRWAVISWERTEEK
ncbi:MAG: class I SAM-dependent methyltransferase [Desulfobulbaceae bacterium]|jgi:SAM-dependent methyltransferase|nr:class I SAM-dependent methyltransferase [Desulfobulbaceae bacterium]